MSWFVLLLVVPFLCALGGLGFVAILTTLTESEESSDTRTSHKTQKSANTQESLLTASPLVKKQKSAETQKATKSRGVPGVVVNPDAMKQVEALYEYPGPLALADIQLMENFNVADLRRI